MDVETYTDIADDLVMTLKDSAMMAGRGVTSVVIYWTDHVPEALYVNVLRGEDTEAALDALHLPDNQNYRVDLGMDEDGDDDEEAQTVLNAFVEQASKDFGEEDELDRNVELFAYWVAAKLGKEMDAVAVSVTSSDERYFNADLFDIAKQNEDSPLDEFMDAASDIELRVS